MQTLSNGVRPSREELIGLRLQAGNLPLHPRQTVQSAIAGDHRSPFRGRGMDYAESRGYQSGDDVRNMDWRVTARSGRAHVKVYQEERERPVVILADFGPGMFFATEGAFKSIIATRAAALVAWAAVQNGDRVGALLYNGQHHELRPTRGQRGALHLIRELTRVADPANAGTGLQHAAGSFSTALMRLHRVTRPGSLVFMFSDFYHLASDSKRHLQLLRRHNDVVACQILDRLEMQAPAPGRYPVMTGNRRGILDTRSATQRDAWTRHFAERRQRANELMQQCAIPLLHLSTADDVGQRLRQALTRPKAAERDAA
ncbi:MAG TPA: DUF58 domain-containing protein [Gammaproteobacteria bacterium]|nr:DUF58 domain-containing protein [Gammaproteobacteria bacterium]